MSIEEESETVGITVEKAKQKQVDAQHAIQEILRALEEDTDMTVKTISWDRTSQTVGFKEYIVVQSVSIEMTL